MADMDESEEERKRDSGMDLPGVATSVVKQETEKLKEQKTSKED